MEHMEIAFLLLVGACVLAFMLGNEYAKHQAQKNKRELTFVYEIKHTKRDRYRLNIYNSRGSSMLISSGNGHPTTQRAHDVIKDIQKAQFVFNDIES